MTLILGLEHRGRVHMLGDRISIDSEDGARIVRDPKIFTSGEWVFGVAGSWHVAGLVRFRLQPPRMARTASPLEAGFELENHIRRVLTAEGYTPRTDTEDTSWELLAGWRGTLFTLDSAFSTTRPADGVEAVGASLGVAAARAALLAQKPFRSAPELVMRRAAQIAADGCAAVRGPFDYLSVG